MTIPRSFEVITVMKVRDLFLPQMRIVADAYGRTLGCKVEGDIWITNDDDSLGLMFRTEAGQTNKTFISLREVNDAVDAGMRWSNRLGPSMWRIQGPWRRRDRGRIYRLVNAHIENIAPGWKNGKLW